MDDAQQEVNINYEKKEVSFNKVGKIGEESDTIGYSGYKSDLYSQSDVSGVIDGEAKASFSMIGNVAGPGGDGFVKSVSDEPPGWVKLLFANMDEDNCDLNQKR